MADAPNLVIQLQRMGDLVLSFPLFAWLRRLEPERPLWVAAEPSFYEALLPLAPPVIFAPLNAAMLRQTRFHRVINLSHRPEAARLTGELQAEFRAGGVERNGVKRIAGAWHLYRASLVHNNRHNRFHWADLNGLDLFAELDPDGLRRCLWPDARSPRGTGRVGLFVGASEAAKRPEPAFWGELAAGLMRRGLNPVFLGGPAERELGAQASRLARIPHANLCGRFSLAALVRFLAELDLLVTPDTGPMHVGAWGGTLTLNLSMGPVNAWETAPFPPGHLVLRPTTSCVGCWSCTRGPEPPCRERFMPGRVAALIHSLLKTGHTAPTPPGLRLLRTGRSVQGLFDLTPAFPRSALTEELRPRDRLGEFWRQWFLHSLGGPADTLPEALTRLDEGQPPSLAVLRRSLTLWQTRLAAELRRGVPAGDWWRRTPPLIRPLSGYLQLFLENGDYDRGTRLAALAHAEALRAALNG